MAKTKSDSKQMSINIVASLLSFAVTIGINFFLTPHLVKTLGSEAYGFIGLANNFVQYATIVTAALNAMSGRFISIEYHRGNLDKASRLFSSVFVADLIIAGVMLVLSALMTVFLDSFLNIPPHLVESVKITFALTFLTFIISVITAIFTTATYVKNRVDINSVRDIMSNLLKVGVVLALFTFLPPQLYFLSCAMLASGLFLLVTNISVKKKILPEVTVRVRDFQFGLVRVLIASGVWMSMAQLSAVLLSGLDLLICNLTLGAAMMGLLSIAKTVPLSFATLISTLANVFAPHYTILYSKNKIAELVYEVKFTSRIVSFILTIPIAGFMVFGYEFYRLWQPTKSAEEILMIQILSVLTCIQFLFTAHTQCLTMLNSVCNKMKLPVLVALGIGVVSTLSVLAVVAVMGYSNQSVYAIAGISSLLMSLRAIVFIPIYSAYLLKQKKTVFYPCMFKGWISFAIAVAFFLLVKFFVSIHSWLLLLAVCLPAGIVAYAVIIPVMFTRQEIGKIKGKIMRKLHR